MERRAQDIGAEWGLPPTPGDHQMPLGERIKALRTEAGLSQAELAEQVGGDGRQISRYENGRITPSLDALARIAEALNVSLDHLVFDDIARRPLHSPENILGDRLAAIAELNDDDRSSLLNVIDGLVTKSRVRTLAVGVS
ncbi:MAG: helix-turn-helix domain-containing protein [Acidimicrobiales bacterium]